MCTFFNAALADKMHKWDANALYALCKGMKERESPELNNRGRDRRKWKGSEKETKSTRVLQFVQFIVEKLPYLRAHQPAGLKPTTTATVRTKK